MKNDRERDIFRKYLERRGFKLTAERQALFDELFARHEHFEADELLVRLRAKHKKISRATIYRTLELLVDSGIVGRVRIGSPGYRYERLRAGEHHDHLICNECGRVIEFFEPRIESLQDEVCERYGFLPLSPQPPDARHLPPVPAARQARGRSRPPARSGRGAPAARASFRAADAHAGATAPPFSRRAC